MESQVRRAGGAGVHRDEWHRKQCDQELAAEVGG